MDLNFSESEQLVQSTLREYLASEVSSELVGRCEASRELPLQLWNQLAEQGWLGVGSAKAGGSQSGSLIEWAIVLQELGRVAFPAPVVEQLSAARFLAGLASVGRECADEVASGARIVTLAFQDRPDDPVLVRPTGAEEGVLSGTKMLVPYGQSAQTILVAAPLGPTPGYWQVAADAAGVTFESLQSVSRNQQTALRFRDASAQSLGAEELVAGRDLRELYRLASDAFCLGLLDRIVEMTVEYARQREQFGRPIGSFQAVQYHCVDMALAYHGARNHLFQSVWLVERGRPSSRESAMCHAAVRDAAGEVVARAHQVHGALGATNDFALQQFTRRAKIYQHTLGTAAQFREEVAELDESLVLPEASEPLAGGFA